MTIRREHFKTIYFQKKIVVNINSCATTEVVYVIDESYTCFQKKKNPTPKFSRTLSESNKCKWETHVVLPNSRAEIEHEKNRSQQNSINNNKNQTRALTLYETAQIFFEVVELEVFHRWRVKNKMDDDSEQLCQKCDLTSRTKHKKKHVRPFNSRSHIQTTMFIKIRRRIYHVEQENCILGYRTKTRHSIVCLISV